MPEEKLAEVKTTFIFKAYQLQDNNGRHVIERVVLSGEAPKDFTRFTIPYQIQIPATPIGPVNWQIEIPLPDVKTAAEAFDQMGEAVKLATPKAMMDIEKFVHDQVMAAKKQIAVASEIPSGLLGPGGQPIPGPGSGGFDPRGGPKKPRH